MYKEIQKLDKILFELYADDLEMSCHGQTFCSCNSRCACNTQRYFIEDKDNEKIYYIFDEAM
jgi:hypothetical protein